MLVLVEEKTCSCTIDSWQVVVVDGKRIKPDTWYSLHNGEVIEITDK